MVKKSSLFKAGLVLAFGLTTSAYAVDACKDEMTKARGSEHRVQGNQTGSISGTPWGFEQWSQGGSNNMSYFDNGTFKADWSNNQDFLARVGYRYGDNGSGVDHKTKYYTVDYKYTKTGTAQYGYIGIYGWTVNPQIEYYIVDDWYSKPSEAYIGPKFGEITVDGAKYTIHAFLRDQEPSKTGTSTFVQFFSVRATPRQCGHIDISAHFNKWDELFHGQTANLPTSKNGKKDATLKFGRVTEVMLMTEAGGNATGSVDYSYFDMTDAGSPSEIIPPKDITRGPYKGKAAAIPGTIEAENFDEGNEGVAYNGAQGASGDDGDHEYRGEDYSSVDIVNAGDGKAIGYTAADEWLEYTVEVAKDGEYEIEANVSNGSGSGTVELSLDGKDLVSLPFTGTTDDWNAYELAKGKATLTAGKHTLRVTIATANTNVDYVKFTLPGVDITPGGEGDESAINTVVRLNNVNKTYQVFDMQGRFLGNVNVAAGATVKAALKANFKTAGVYMVKQGSFMQRIAVK